MKKLKASITVLRGGAWAPAPTSTHCGRLLVSYPSPEQSSQPLGSKGRLCISASWTQLLRENTSVLTGTTLPFTPQVTSIHTGLTLDRIARLRRWWKVKGWDVCMLYASITLFDKRDLSVQGFWYLRGPWNQQHFGANHRHLRVSILNNPCWAAT